MQASCTAVSSPNMAASKYIGQREGGAENLPNNSTIRMTLRGVNQPLMTITSVLFSSSLGTDAAYVDGKPEGNAKGVVRILDALRIMSGRKEKMLMASCNSYPKDSGIASSSASASALALAASQALGLNLSKKELSILSRKGSGSACGSVHGGWTKWNKGELKDGSDSYAEQLHDENYWPELVDLIVVLYSSPKKISTDESHRRAVSSPLYSSFVSFTETATQRIDRALSLKDFQALALTMMEDSNAMHSALQSAIPPVRYMTDRTWSVIDFVNSFNASKKAIAAGYTVDAGSNMQVLTTERDKGEVLNGIKQIGCERVIEAKGGPGARVVDNRYSLIDESALAPKDIDVASVFSELQRKI